MWKVEYKKRFLKELSKLPENVQAQAEKVVFEDLICENPFDLGYIEQMQDPHRTIQNRHYSRQTEEAYSL